MQVISSIALLLIVILNSWSCYAPGNSTSTERQGQGQGSSTGGAPSSSTSSSGYNVTRNIEYGTDGGQSLKLDLWMPKDATGPVPVIVWVHGGAWQKGDKSLADPYAPLFAKRGYAVASVNYRLAPSGHYPAQIQEVKGAIRFLRANASKYNLNSDKVGLLGTSSGGVLASQVGVSCGKAEWEGSVGGNTSYSSCVQAVVNCFGAFIFERTPASGEGSGIEKLLGCAYSTPQCQAKLKEMSPQFYIDKSDPPFLNINGGQDRSMPGKLCPEWHQKLKAAGVQSTLITDPGYGHDTKLISAHLSDVISFLDQNLKS